MHLDRPRSSSIPTPLCTQGLIGDTLTGRAGAVFSNVKVILIVWLVSIVRIRLCKIPFCHGQLELCVSGNVLVFGSRELLAHSLTHALRSFLGLRQ
jgi:hypothetical protein